MAHSIYIMALITTALAVLAIGGFLRWKSPPRERLFLLLLLLAELPMCALAFYLVRMPLLDVAVRHVLDSKSPLYHFVMILYAPLTEEPAKIWLLLLPAVRRRITRENFWRAALALGLGFGIGELWFLAYSVTLNPQLDNHSWYQFAGFLNERFMVCILHGAFVSLTLFFFTRGKFILGLSLAMLAHFLCNFPVYLSKINFGNLGAPAWSIIISLFLPFYLLAGISWLAYLATGHAQFTSFMFGNSICPECHAEYPSPLLAVNLLTKRYERCPHCRKWHLVSRFRNPGGAAAAPPSNTPISETPTDPPSSAA